MKSINNDMTCILIKIESVVRSNIIIFPLIIIYYLRLTSIYEMYMTVEIVRVIAKIFSRRMSIIDVSACAVCEKIEEYMSR